MVAMSLHSILKYGIFEPPWYMYIFACGPGRWMAIQTGTFFADPILSLKTIYFSECIISARSTKISNNHTHV